MVDSEVTLNGEFKVKSELGALMYREVNNTVLGQRLLVFNFFEGLMRRVRTVQLSCIKHIRTLPGVSGI